MKKRTLGNTNLLVSEIAFGGVEIGIPYGLGVSSESDMLPESAAIHLLHASLDRGINFIDTARMYGNSEQLIGKAFKDRRADIVLSTKCVHLRDKNGDLPCASAIGNVIERSLTDSLTTLQTHYVDIFMLHQVDQSILENDDVANVFIRLKQEGKIRATGASTYSVEETKLAIESGIWDVIQLPFNLMDQRQGMLFGEAHKKGVGIVVRSVLLKGLLSSRGKNLHPALINVEKHIENYHKLVNETGFSLPSLATKFALSFPEVSSVLVGIDKMEYLQQALDAGNGVYLTDTQLECARRLSYPDPGFLNLPYWDKMNWLK